jgi:uncharacterized protein (TIGR04551 family)
MLRSLALLSPLVVLTALSLVTTAARAQAPASPPADAGTSGDETPSTTPSSSSAEDAGTAGDASPAASDDPALPASTDAAPVTDEAPVAPVDDGVVDSDDLARLRTQLKEEIAAELRQEMQADIEAAARDAARQRSASIEWEEERWVEEVKPKLNFLEIDGYFRLRADWMYRMDLGTYDPVLQRGTSMVKPPTLYRPYDGEPGCAENNVPDAYPGQVCEGTAEDTNTLYGMNMRLRLDPTLNVSEDIRVRMTVDVLDNLVLGSTPESKPGFVNNPTLPLPLFASSQNPVQEGLNATWDAVRVKRVWAEVMTPFGQLRFGRQPQHFGLGLLVNDGNDLDDDFGSNADQVLFATRIAGHYIVPAYSISSVGAVGRGGGSGAGGDNGLMFFPNEQGQRNNLDPRDDVHTFILTVVKKDKPEDIKAQLRTNWPLVNYGFFAAYRRQDYDTPIWYNSLDPSLPPSIDMVVRRNANAGIGSGWFLFQWEKFKFESEIVGVIGHIEKTATVVSGDINAVDPALNTVDGDQPLWILQGGAAFESSYSFLNDSLVVGLNGGVASGDQAPGFGLRSTLNQTPQKGDLDGKQYGECLEENGDGECLTVDNSITNYRFNPDYQVDMILFREVLGTVTDAAYIKPHIGYYLTENIGARAEIMYAHALYMDSTPGQQNPLGVEIDGKAFYGSDDGLFLMLQGGFLLPLGALNHARDPNDPNIGKNFGTAGAEQRVNERFLNAQFAYTVQAFAGVVF